MQCGRCVCGWYATEEGADVHGHCVSSFPHPILVPNTKMTTLPCFCLSVVHPITTRPSTLPAKLCLDLGIIGNEACAALQESTKHPCDDIDNAETPAASRKKGSFNSNWKGGKYPMEWGNLAEFDVWCWKEELTYSIKLVRSSVKCGNELWLESAFTCACANYLVARKGTKRSILNGGAR